MSLVHGTVSITVFYNKYPTMREWVEFVSVVIFVLKHSTNGIVPPRFYKTFSLIIGAAMQP
jgi:hypothetical protein